jgi:hypothetical protein
MVYVNREDLLGSLFDNHAGLNATAQNLISSLVYELSFSDAVEWAVRNEFVPDPDANADGDYPDALLYEEGDAVEVYVKGSWIAGEVVEVDDCDRDLPYLVHWPEAPEEEGWVSADDVRPRST